MAICCLCPSAILSCKSCVNVFHYSNNRLVASALCLNNSYPNGLSVIQYRFNQPIVLFNDLVPLSLLTENQLSPYYINNQYLYPWCLSALSRCTAPPLWRASAFDLKRRSCSWPLMLLYEHVLLVGQGVHNMRSISLDYPGQARLSN